VIPLQRLREDPELYREGARLKGEDAPIDEILDLDGRARELRTATEGLKGEQNSVSRALRGAPTPEQRTALDSLKARIKDGEIELRELDARIGDMLLAVPNPPHPSVPVGRDEADNVVVRTWGEPARFAFAPAAHYDIGERLGIFDFERAAKISGARFAVLRGEGARLQRALTTFFLDSAIARGYTEIAPPYLVREEAMVGTANLPKFAGDFYTTEDDLFLIPTAEVPVTNLYREEILEPGVLPIRHVAFTPCWRREAGAAGKDTRGYIRMHQFDKVELVKFVEPATSLDELEGLVGDAEAVLQALGLHYRVLSMCTGDMGFAQWKKYDLEVWAPGMGRWLEVSSCSVFGDFQSRRMNLRFRPGAQERPLFPHTINGSGVAVVRTVSALLETCQRSDGTVDLPAALLQYMGGIERLGAQ
jgi:seryl-tRNA synthetase